MTANEGVDPFTGWNENVYPPENLLLPKDEKRPYPVTVFERCAFSVTSWSKAKFMDFAAANGIKLVNCVFNGVLIATAES